MCILVLTLNNLDVREVYSKLSHMPLLLLKPTNLSSLGLLQCTVKEKKINTWINFAQFVGLHVHIYIKGQNKEFRVI